MNRRILGLLIAVAFSLVVGCGTVGSNFDGAHVKNIKNHVTTQSEILEMFGLPFKEGTENGNVMWTYQYDKKYVGGDSFSKDLVILFDERDRVKAFRYTNNFPEDKQE
ncbi:MAG: hypothetical protein ACE5EK_03895 [Nitrospinales bacterium]